MTMTIDQYSCEYVRTAIFTAQVKVLFWTISANWEFCWNGKGSNTWLETRTCSMNRRSFSSVVENSFHEFPANILQISPDLILFWQQQKHVCETHSSFPDDLKGMQLSDFRLKVFLCFLLVSSYLYLQQMQFNQFDKHDTVLSASKSSVKSFTANFHFFSAFSSGPRKVTILVLAHNSVKVESTNKILIYSNILCVFFALTNMKSSLLLLKIKNHHD